MLSAKETLNWFENCFKKEAVRGAHRRILIAGRYKAVKTLNRFLFSSATRGRFIWACRSSLPSQTEKNTGRTTIAVSLRAAGSSTQWLAMWKLGFDSF
jgi:hypothetical protein